MGLASTNVHAVLDSLGVSKAFTKEGDGGADETVLPVDEWPAGVKNYVTPAGLAALKAELESTTDARRKRALAQRLEAAEVIDPAQLAKGGEGDDRARFGATVSVADDDGKERTLRIVGVDEADPARGWVSWRSPIARALLGRAVGDTTTLRTPAGTQELTVTKIHYES
jgi:transcription elongation factor GreB